MTTTRVKMTNNMNMGRRMKTKDIVLLVVCIAVPLIVGIVSSMLTRGQMMSFNEMNKPPLAPPAWLFPIAWTILYVLMGIASYLIIKSDSKYKVAAVALYISQLMMNAIWSPVFFNMQNYMAALGVLLSMWTTIIILAILSWFINKKITLLLLPLILWTTFAAYLNAGIGALNT